MLFVILSFYTLFQYGFGTLDEDTCLIKGCNYSWVDDGWCDTDCESIQECNYDGNDCECNDSCYELYEVFILLANLITVTDDIELE